MPARDVLHSFDLGHLTFGILSTADTTRDADACAVGLDGLVVGKLIGGFNQPAVRADEVFELSSPRKTGF